MPHKAAIAALTSSEAIKTNAVAAGGIILASVPATLSSEPETGALLRNLILVASLIYTGAKATEAVIRAVRIARSEDTCRCARTGKRRGRRA